MKNVKTFGKIICALTLGQMKNCDYTYDIEKYANTMEWEFIINNKEWSGKPTKGWIR